MIESMAMTPLRVGIAGYGLSGAVFHAPLIAATEGLAVTAILTRSPERGAAAAQAHPDARVVADPEAPGGETAFLAAATPNSSPVAPAPAGLKPARGVVVNTPPPPPPAAARGVLGAGGRLTVSQNRRWD